MLVAALAGAMLCAGAPALRAQDSAGLPRLYTNQQLIEDLSRRPDLDITDVKAVFRHVLGALPERVQVYPTENYYYFYFYHHGIKYAGNLRLSPETREKGQITFIYFKATTGWQDDEQDNYALLGAADGVTVEKTGPLAYKVSHEGKSVTFELNDLSAVRPPAEVLKKGERFIGPVFDESGIRFFLVFDDTRKVFHYVLDETVAVNDELVRPEGLKHVLLGRRTGFAFARDGVGDRKILIGVFGPNAEENNELDGPFDQLPDNFVEGTTLRDAMVLAGLGAGQVLDRLGNHPDGQTREAIAPYMEYYAPEDLEAADNCVAKARGAPVYDCLEKTGRE